MFFTTKSISSEKSFHDFSIESISGKDIVLADYKDKVVLLVNTASQCGFTPQYAGLQKIYDRYKDDGFVVLGVPSDDFNQELSNDEDVKKFCEIRYGVNFPLTSIQKIKGDSAHPLYKWISGNTSVIGQPRWNFHKYLISKEGQILNWFSSMTSPTSEGLLKQVEQALYN
ncbi:MAG: glutathione peroxidase [Rickettsiales bacterium]|nr:glutathione peroxidase [Rickettsiales bacterium]RPG14613.1 MAG: glutathione peroxidase [Pelagibacteraceae bacterium TMED195]|tara:strand:+ start:1397 stop:1906 length:510 start_codon:yes stop_codon:yes gene_type:complete